MPLPRPRRYPEARVMTPGPGGSGMSTARLVVTAAVAVERRRCARSPLLSVSPERGSRLVATGRRGDRFRPPPGRPKPLPSATPDELVQTTVWVPAPRAALAGSRCFLCPATSQGAPGRIRTSDARFRKPTLYPLSYGGRRWSPRVPRGPQRIRGQRNPGGTAFSPSLGPELVGTGRFAGCGCGSSARPAGIVGCPTPLTLRHLPAVDVGRGGGINPARRRRRATRRPGCRGAARTPRRPAARRPGCPWC